MSPTLVADGSSSADSHPRVVIDRFDTTDRWRFRCPNNHTRWEPTNSHIHCKSCAEQPDVDPEYWELLDAQTGETVPYSAVELR